MKLYHLSLLEVTDGNAKALSTTSDLSSFSFYQRGSVGEFMTFMAKTVAERTAVGQRQSVQENSYTAHVYNAGRDGLAGTPPTDQDTMGGVDSCRGSFLAVVITDEEYPVRPAFSLLQKLIDDFITTVPKSQWSNPSSIDFPAARTYLAKYQDPKQADAIMRVQAELDETKIILVCQSATDVKWNCLLTSLPFIAQDHRRCSPTWRTFRHIGGAIQRSQCVEQGVLQDGEECESSFSPFTQASDICFSAKLLLCCDVNPSHNEAFAIAAMCPKRHMAFNGPFNLMPPSISSLFNQ